LRWFGNARSIADGHGALFGFTFTFRFTPGKGTVVLLAVAAWGSNDSNPLALRAPTPEI
jgi:hypothetical protein